MHFHHLQRLLVLSAGVNGGVMVGGEDYMLPMTFYDQIYFNCDRLRLCLSLL